MGETLEVFDDDRIIPTFGFGDYYTRFIFFIIFFIFYFYLLICLF
jgi:hypothetical protein